MPVAALPPRIEYYLSRQADFYTRRAAEEAVQPGPYVTISREYGCQGFPLAGQLVERLNGLSPEPVPWVAMDRDVVEAIAERKGRAAAEFVEALRERRRGHIQQTVEVLFGRRLIEYQAYEALVESLLSLARAGRVVLVGLGGAIVCAALPRGFHVLMVAPLEWRAKKIARERGVSVPEAMAIATREGNNRDAFVREFTGKALADPLHYDIVFNNARCPVGEMVELTMAAMRGRGLV